MGRRSVLAKTAWISCAFASLIGALCGCDGMSPSDHVCGVTQPLLTGTSHAEYIGLSDAEENAVVELTFRMPGGTETCTGTLIAADSILTAAHCTHGSAQADVTIRLGPSSAHPLGTLRSSKLLRHSTLDLLLVGVDSRDTADSSPIAAAFVDSRILSRAKAQIAGFGLDDEQNVGVRRFSVERFAEIVDDALSVDGSELGGPCGGDSGGPLLARDGRGAPALVGVLAGGAAGCHGVDTYTRVTREVVDWLATNGVPTEASLEELQCGAIDDTGRCFGDRALWCSEGMLAVDVCAESCGWDDHAGGFRCVSTYADPCRGIPREGACDGDVARYCAAGIVESTDCGICGRGCVLSPNSGGAACVR